MKHTPSIAQSAAECETYYSVSLLLWLGSFDPGITKGILEVMRSHTKNKPERTAGKIAGDYIR